jgi:hypothetical protein
MKKDGLTNYLKERSKSSRKSIQLLRELKKYLMLSNKQPTYLIFDHGKFAFYVDSDYEIIRIKD